MINNAIYILLVLLALGEIVLIVCFVNLMHKTKDATDLKEYYNFMVKLQQENNSQHRTICELFDNMDRTWALMNEQYKVFNDSYKIMIHQLKTISEQYQKILEVWKSVEERYSDCFEQYKHTHERLKECMDLMTPIATEIPESIEELGMKLNDVQEIVGRIDENTRPTSVIINYPKWKTDDVVLTDHTEGDLQ